MGWGGMGRTGWGGLGWQGPMPWTLHKDELGVLWRICSTKWQRECSCVTFAGKNLRLILAMWVVDSWMVRHPFLVHFALESRASSSLFVGVVFFSRAFWSEASRKLRPASLLLQMISVWAAQARIPMLQAVGCAGFKAHVCWSPWSSSCFCWCASGRCGDVWRYCCLLRWWLGDVTVALRRMAGWIVTPLQKELTL